MHAIAYEKFGPASVLKLVEVPLPKRNPGEVLVKVHAAGVNPIDYKVRLSLCLQPEGHAIQGAAALPLHHSFLITPGHDMLAIAHCAKYRSGLGRIFPSFLSQGHRLPVETLQASLKRLMTHQRWTSPTYIFLSLLCLMLT